MAELLDVKPLLADGYHNAFTDLLRWKDHYYVSFRTAQSHGMPPNGDVVVYRSPDLADWELCIRLDTGGDDRDPKLVDAGERLAVTFGTWIPRWGDGTRTVPNAPSDLVTHVAASEDGLCWAVPRQVYGVNYWLWRILPAEGGYYCAAYHFGRRDDRDMRTVHLLHSEDLFDWRLLCLMRSGGGCGEPALYQPEPGVMCCVVRTLEPRHHSWLGRSTRPYTEWDWTDLGVMVHAPAVLRVHGKWLVAGRSQEEDLPDGCCEASGSHHTSVWEIADRGAQHVLTVPSAGDCSYPGLALGSGGEVVMSYYSQHERLPLSGSRPTPSDVYLARFAL